MTTSRPICLSFCLFLMGLSLLVSPLSAQHLLSDSAFYQAATSRHLENYQINMGPDNRLYNGPEYLRRGQGVRGYPFFLSDSLLPGNLRYQDATFSHIGLLYDLVSDDLIINDYTHNAYIKLIKEKLTGFSIRQHNFLWLPSEKSTAPVIKTGFYEQLLGSYEAPVSLYCKHEKKVAIPANAEEQPKYIQSDIYFLKLNQDFYPIENLRSLLLIVKDKKDSLKKYIGENHLDFRHDFEQSLIKTIGYYAQIRS